MTRTITFQPSSELSTFIEDLIAAGEYNNQSEVVREALRLLQEQKAQSSLAVLRGLLDEGFNSGISPRSAKDIMQDVLSKKSIQ
ncbi:MAG: antitoxin ParD1/3/4 [Flavobacteriales bacterium]|jgi:antitoxin ParD1/3/4